jgi:hypothetical protein
MTKRIHARAMDTMLTGANRLTAESAPAVGPGDMGVLYAGDPGLPRQLEVARRAIEEAGLLSAADVAALNAILAKYSGSSSTNRVGITSSDAADPLTMGQHEAIESMNKINSDFWAKRAADEARQDLLR